MISRRTLFGFLPAFMVGRAAQAAPKPQSFLAPGHGSVDPPVISPTEINALVRLRHMSNCKLFVMRREEWDRLWFDGRMMHIPEPD